MKGVVFAVLFGVAAAATGHSAADHADLGTWKLNREKSTYSSGRVPQSILLKVELIGIGVRNTSEVITWDGRPLLLVYTAYYDGQDWPMTGYSIANAASHRRIDARTTERTDKMNRLVVQVVTRTVSEDGRTMTIVQKSNAGDNILIYEKQ